MKIKIIFICFFYLLLNSYVLSIEKDYFLTLRYNKVNVRSGPSEKYPIKFIYKKKYFPIKIIDSHYNYRKIIDLYNNSGWIHISQLTKKKSAINISDLSIIFKKPNIYSKPIVKLESGKMVIIRKCKSEWCKISIENYKGWIQKDLLWGRL